MANKATGTRKTMPAREWLARGYHYDDIDLWEELCAWLADGNGGSVVAQMPEHLAPLVGPTKQNTYLPWLRKHALFPVSNTITQNKSGWFVKTEWRERIAVMRDPSPEHLLRWHQRFAEMWAKKRIHHSKRSASEKYWRCDVCNGESDVDTPLALIHGKACGIRLMRLRVHRERRQRRELSALESTLRAEALYFRRKQRRWQPTQDILWNPSKAQGVDRYQWVAQSIADALTSQMDESAVAEYVAYLRCRAETLPYSVGDELTTLAILALYGEAADRVERALQALHSVVSK